MSVSYYFDSSALVKRYIRERGSDIVDAMLRERPQLFTAGLAYCELYACFGRLVRLDYITKKQAAGLCQNFETDWRQMTVIELTPTLRERVPTVAAVSAVRGADLVHLCAALVAAEMRERITFVAADLPLLNAAKKHGLKTANPAE